MTTTKARLVKFLSDIRGIEPPAVKRTPLKPVLLYLMELRSRTGNTGFPKKKLCLPVEWKEGPISPRPVKIVYLKSRHDAAPERVATGV